jgi:hypothetical protein
MYQPNLGHVQFPFALKAAVKTNRVFPPHLAGAKPAKYEYEESELDRARVGAGPQAAPQESKGLPESWFPAPSRKTISS